MSVIDDRVSKLIAEIHDQPSPEEAFSRWMFVDIFILDGLMMLFTIVFMVLRDIIIVMMIGFGSVAFGSAYLYLKDKAKNSLIAGRDFLDSQTLISDYEITEQIAIRAYDYVILPQQTIDGKTIAYSRIDVDDTLGTLRKVPIRVGGSSELRPEAVDNLVRLRLLELKEIEAERREERLEKRETGMRRRFKLPGRKDKKSRLKKMPETITGKGREIGLPDDDLELEKDEPLEIEHKGDGEDGETEN